MITTSPVDCIVVPDHLIDVLRKAVRNELVNAADDFHIGDDDTLAEEAAAVNRLQHLVDLRRELAEGTSVPKASVASAVKYAREDLRWALNGDPLKTVDVARTIVERADALDKLSAQIDAEAGA